MPNERGGKQASSLFSAGGTKGVNGCHRLRCLADFHGDHINPDKIGTLVVSKTWSHAVPPLSTMSPGSGGQDGSVTNIAQALGDKLYVTVDGQGSPASTDTDLPYEVIFFLSFRRIGWCGLLRYTVRPR